MYPPYYIEAGHLFSPDKLHAIVFYSDERSAGMRIYLKKDGDWKKIYEDTTLNNGGGGYDIELKDWNSDGMPDIALNERGPTDEVQRYDLWLMAKDGASVHHIKQFDEVANPEVSKRTGHIISWYVHGAGMTRGEYRFQNDRLVDILQVSVGPSDRQSKDSSGWVHYYRNNATIKEIYCNLDKVYEYVPSHMRKQVKEYYGN